MTGFGKFRAGLDNPGMAGSSVCARQPPSDRPRLTHARNAWGTWLTSSGWLIDHYVHTGGIATAIGVVIGAAGGVYLLVRRMGS